MGMGIPAFKTDEWRVSNEFPDSDVVQIIRDEVVDFEEEGKDQCLMSDHDLERTEAEGRSRKQAISAASTLSRQGPPTKRAHQGL